MDALYFDNQEYFAQRMLDLEATSKPITSTEKPAEYEAPDTSICVRIRPLMDSEIKKKHVKGILTDNSQVVNLHEPRRRVNSKPDLNACSLQL
jgi:kinesin family protein 2/24